MRLAKGLIESVGGAAFDSMQRKLSRKDQASAEAFAAKLGRLAQRFDKKHANRTLNNLEMAFPEWSAGERQRVADAMYAHFGRVFADFLRTPIRSREEVLASTEVVGLEHLEAAEAEGKGCLILTGHFGNWERFGQWVVASGRDLTVVARDANQGKINERMLRLRQAAGLDVLSRGSAIRGIISRLRDERHVGILADQNDSEIFVPFFGKPCGMVKGPATIHLRTGAPMVPGYAVWLSPGRYRIEFQPALVAEEGFEPIEGITRAVCASLEAQIRKHPEQWLWMHDRWKAARQRGLL